MPKTRDAFALKDFDRARILQRPYFKDFNFDKDLTDAKILSSLFAEVDDLISELERKNETLSKLRDKLHKYRGRLSKHAERLRRYYRSKDEQSAEFKRARDLDVSYTIDILPAIGNISTAIALSIKNSDSVLRKRYRERFAERLKKARLNLKITQRDLAERLNYTVDGFRELEKPRSEPNLTALIRLSRNLNVSTDWLLGLK